MTVTTIQGWPISAGGSDVIVTVALCEMVPLAPLQVRVKVAVPADTAVNISIPEVGLLPLHAPEAVQLVTLVDTHSSVKEAPTARVEGLAIRVSVGCDTELMVTAVLCVELPPAPAQASV